MSTNYYMMTTDKEFANKYFEEEYETVDYPYFGYVIHIGKRSCGWKPLFEAHKKEYNSVAEMKQFIMNHPDIHLFDDYCKFISMAQLKEELIDWAESQEKRMIHYDDYIGNIQAPIDHVEMDHRDDRNPWLKIRYWHDKDGCDFTDRPFS